MTEERGKYSMLHLVPEPTGRLRPLWQRDTGYRDLRVACFSADCRTLLFAAWAPYGTPQAERHTFCALDLARGTVPVKVYVSKSHCESYYLAISRNGRYVLAQAWPDMPGCDHLFDLETGAELSDNWPIDGPSGCLFTPDDSALIVAGTHHIERRPHPYMNAEKVVLDYDKLWYERAHRLSACCGALAVSPRGDLAAVGIHQWPPMNPNFFEERDRAKALAKAGPDSGLFPALLPRAELNLEPEVPLDHPIVLFDPATMGPTNRIRGTGSPVVDLTFSPDGRLLLACRWNGDVSLYHLESGDKEEVFHGRKERVVNAVFSSSGKLVAVADASGCIGVWDLERGHAVVPPTKCHGEEIRALQFVGEDRLISIDKGGIVSEWCIDRP